MQREMQMLPATPPFESLYRQDSSVVDQPVDSKPSTAQAGNPFTATPARRFPSTIRDFDNMPTNPLAFGQSPQVLNDPGEASA